MRYVRYRLRGIYLWLTLSAATLLLYGPPVWSHHSADGDGDDESLSWAWIGGPQVGNMPGTYGEQRMASVSDEPGARNSSAYWADEHGRLWLFGGFGYDSKGTLALLNDLWRFDGKGWTWMSGSSVAPGMASYGQLGDHSPHNIPGARDGMGFGKESGHFLLFGGSGYDSANVRGLLSDLWRFNGRDWVWVGGSNLANQSGSYTSKRGDSSLPRPGGRYAMASSSRGEGLWVFGGEGFDQNGTRGWLNDLWRYEDGHWLWKSGSSSVNSIGVYTKNLLSAMPGARRNAVSAIDGEGSLLVFGGNGYDGQGNTGFLNDLWKFDGKHWTWLVGSAQRNEAGVYGTKGVPAAENMPGGRMATVVWVDSRHTVWMFGGYGYDAEGNVGYLNDLWKFDGHHWIWMAGDTTRNQVAVYGVKGKGDVNNTPGSKIDPALWRVRDGIMLWGGYGTTDSSKLSFTSDFWRLDR